MIKRTLYFGNPAYLRTSNKQLILDLPEISIDKKAESPITTTRSIPIEDIGLLILDHPQITVTQSLLAGLLENNVAVVTCDQAHHPVGMLLNLRGNSLQALKCRHQSEASLPLKKQLWQQTVMAKIRNQAAMLRFRREEHSLLLNLASSVKSGDGENLEAQAAAYYWKKVFSFIPDFRRNPDGPPPNNILNYGYSILRAIVARNLVGSGLLPTLGIHHKNQYNSYCLADDIMEPYRPYVDYVAFQIVRNRGSYLEMSPGVKKSLLEIPAMDVFVDGKKSPLMNAVQRTTASLAKCFEGTARKIIYPEFHFV